jgi:hypothetical protein
MSELISKIRPLAATNAAIIQQAEQFTRQFAWTMPSFPAELFTINFDYIYENYIYPEFGIELKEGCKLGCDDAGEKILGAFDVERNVVYLDRVLDDRKELVRHKRVFTCWHEVGGHAILQGDWLRSEASRLGKLGIVTTESSLTEHAVSVLERQANLFAAHAAAPTWFLDYVIRATYELRQPFRYIGPRDYWFCVQGTGVRRHLSSFNELAKVIARDVQHRFGGLSIESLSYRIEASRWLIDDGPSYPSSSPLTLFRTMPTSSIATFANAAGT